MNHYRIRYAIWIVISIILISLSISIFCSTPRATADEGTETSSNERMFIDTAPYVLDGLPLEQYPPEIVKTMPFVSSPRACVLDKHGNILFGKNVYEQCKIASITKIMTALVAAEYPMDFQIHVSENAASIPGSFAGIVAGDTSDLYEMIDGLMLPSGNDAAYAIAENLGRDMLVRENRTAESEDMQSCIGRFVEAMNAKAAEIGMKDSFFSNPCGLDDEGFEGEHHSTAYDVAVMLSVASNTYPVAEIMSKTSDSLLCTRNNIPYELPLENTNRILQVEEKALGGKTGFTDLAGRCVATNFSGKNQETYSIAVLGAITSDRSFLDSTKLFKWVDSSKRKENPLHSGNKEPAVLAEIQLPEHLGKKLKCGVADSKSLSYEKFYWKDDYSVRLKIDAASLTGTIEQNTEIGEVILIDPLSSEPVCTQPLLAFEDVEKVGCLEQYAINMANILHKVNVFPF